MAQLNLNDAIAMPLLLIAFTLSRRLLVLQVWISSGPFMAEKAQFAVWTAASKGLMIKMMYIPLPLHLLNFFLFHSLSWLSLVFPTLQAHAQDPKLDLNINPNPNACITIDSGKLEKARGLFPLQSTKPNSCCMC